MEILIPGTGLYTIKTLVLDLNGTLCIKGKLVPGVKRRIQTLQKKGFHIVLFSGDTRGNAQKIAKNLKIDFKKAATAQEKLLEIKKLHPKTCATIGNGRIDLLQMKAARLSIATLQAEGVHTKTLQAADILVSSVNDALDLFIDEKSLIATLRT